MKGNMNIEARFFELVRYVGILAPLPTAYLIGDSVYKKLHWPWPVAIIAAIIVEGIGFGAVYEYILFREYNQTKRKTDAPAPTHYAFWLVVAYVVSVLMLTIVLDVFPGAATFASAIFPFLSLIGMAITALRNDHQSRLQVIETEKAEKKDARLQARKQEVDSQPGPLPAFVAPSLPVQSEPVANGLQGNRYEILQLLLGNRTLPQGTIAQQVGITRQAVGKHIRFLKDNGYLNGQDYHA